MTSWPAIDALGHQFELWGINETSNVVSLVDDDEIAGLIRGALRRCGASAVEIRPIKTGPGSAGSRYGNPTLMAALDHAHLVIDALGDFEPDHQRVLRLTASASQADRFPPNINLDRRVERLALEVQSGTALTLVDRHDTALRVDLGAASVSGCGGRSNQAGSVVHFPSGWVRVSPDRDGCDGEILLVAGDANLSAGHHVRTPCRLVLRSGALVDIDGEAGDADVLRALLERADRGDAYRLAAITIGMNPSPTIRAEPFAPLLLDPELARLGAGTVTVAFGDPVEPDVELVLPERGLEVDGHSVIRTGTLWGDFAPDIYEQL